VGPRIEVCTATHHEGTAQRYAVAARYASSLYVRDLERVDEGCGASDDARRVHARRALARLRRPVVLGQAGKSPRGLI